MIKSFKVMLKPNNRQTTKLFQYANTARFAYNWALSKEQEIYTENGTFIQHAELRKIFTQLKKTDEYKWLNNISNNVTKMAIKDACNAYIRFFKNISKYPKFKSKKHAKLSFYQSTDRIKFTKTHVKVEGFANSKKRNKQKINWIRLAENNRIPFGENVNYYNPRITFDGIHWWISVSVEMENAVADASNYSEGIGIDLGIKDLAVVSNNNVYSNINKTHKIKKLEKRKRRLQRKISKKYKKNKEGKYYKKTNGIIKSEKILLKLNSQLTNIRTNYIHQITSSLVKRKPSFIVLEDLNVKGMMKNKHLSKSIQEQKFYEFRRILAYKCNWNNIEFIVADRWFPSSKLCSCCGSIKKNLRLSDRTYHCTECGNVIDRDYQASINLRNYGEQQVASTN